MKIKNVSIIDHVSTNKPDRVSSSGIISCGISDHDAVYLVRSMRMPKMRRDLKTVTVRKFRRFDLDAFKSHLQGVHFDEVKSLSFDPKEMWLIWKTLFSDVLNKHALKSNMAWVPSLICKNQYFCHCGITMSCMAVKFCTSKVFRT